MPKSPPKPCCHYGCKNYQVKNGYCLDHQGDYVPRHKQDSRLPASQRGYGWTWVLFRKAYLRRHPVCNRCNKPAMVAHHIIEIDQGGGQYDENNLEPLCRSCHERHHNRA